MAARRTSHTRQAALALALGAAWVLTAPAAQAQLNLRWEAPPGCPRGSEVLNRIRALAGSSLEKTENLSAEGKITPANGRFHLTLLVRDGRDVRKRVIVSESCADLAGAAAISLALLLGIDVSAAEPQAGTTARNNGASGEDGRSNPGDRGGKDRTAPSNERGSEDRGDQRDEPPEPNPTPSPNRWDFLLRAPILIADLGPLPHPSFGAGLGVGARYQSWRFLLAGHLYSNQTVDATDIAGGLGAGADLKRMNGHLALCHGWRGGAFEIAPCLGLALEHLSARGFGTAVNPESQQALWLAPSAGAVVHWYPLKSLALFAGLTGYVELARPRLVIDGLGQLQQLAPVAAGAAIGVEWIL